MRAQTAPPRGRFITFEGGEGSGKSTQIMTLAKQLAAQDISAITTREPGGSPDAENIRAFILGGGAKPLGALAETFLFSAARLDHVRTRIAPALRAGQWVLCDRFADSTRAYQGAAGRVDMTTVRAIEHVAVDGCVPDLTVILDVPVEIGLQRAAGRRAIGAAADRFEGEALDFHARIRQAFIDLARDEPQRCILIDGHRDASFIAADVWRAVELRLLQGAGA
ncbi:MAG: dTMP kinase [Beijerinckiaceae bacterium]